MDRIVVVFFIYMIGVGFFILRHGYGKYDFLSILMGYTPIKRLFAVTTRLDKRLRFPDSRKAVQCTVIKLQPVSGKAPGMVGMNDMAVTQTARHVTGHFGAKGDLARRSTAFLYQLERPARLTRKPVSLGLGVPTGTKQLIPRLCAKRSKPS